MLPAQLLLAVSLAAQVPSTDIRNTDIPNTDTHFTMRTYSSLHEWETHKRHLRLQILAAAGLLPLPQRTPLRPRVTGRSEHGDYSVEKVLIETLPGYFLGGNLYHPLGKRGKFPGVLSAHGHWKHGRFEDTLINSVPGRAIGLARQGYIVFSYDMNGYGDTKQLDHSFGGRTEQLWGFTPLGLQLWNSMRALDFLQSLKDVDDSRLAMTGESGGGTQTFLMAAVDPRIKVSAPVVMVSGIMQGGCVCENAPGLRIDTFNAEIAAMMAPKPMIVVSATGDWTKNVPKEEYPAIQKIYALYGKTGNVESEQFQSQHNYNKDSREAVYRFFAKHLQKDPNLAAAKEAPFQTPPESELKVLPNDKPPEGAADAASIFTRWKEIGTVPNERFARPVLATYLTVSWPAQVEAEFSNKSIALTRVGVGDRVGGQWYPGNPEQRAVLVIHSDGADAARRMPVVEKLIKQGRSVMLIDAFQTGKAKAPRDRGNKHFTTFNHTDEAARVQDILTALSFLKSQKHHGIDLVGINGASVWTVFAGAVAEVPLRVYADLGNFKGTDEDFLKHFFVPGIQRAGGLAAAIKLAKPMKWPEL